MAFFRYRDSFHHLLQSHIDFLEAGLGLKRVLGRTRTSGPVHPQSPNVFFLLALNSPPLKPLGYLTIWARPIHWFIDSLPFLFFQHFLLYCPKYKKNTKERGVGQGPYIFLQNHIKAKAYSSHMAYVIVHHIHPHWSWAWFLKTTWI